MFYLGLPITFINLYPLFNYFFFNSGEHNFIFQNMVNLLASQYLILDLYNVQSKPCLSRLKCSLGSFGRLSTLP